MKQKITILVAVFVLSLAAGFTYRNARQAVPKPATQSPQPLLSCSPSQVERITLNRNLPSGTSDELSFLKQLPSGVDSKSEVLAELFADWQMLSPRNSEGNNLLLSNIVNMLCELSRETPYTDKNSFAELGLESPVVEVRLFEKDKKWILRFGKKTDSSHIIAALAKTPEAKEWEIFWIPIKLAFLLQMPEPEFQNRNVLKMNADNIEELKFLEHGRENFSLERQGEGWIVKSAGKNLGPANDEAQKFVNRLSSLQSIGYETTEYDPHECEKLVKVSYLIEIQGIAGKKETVRFTRPQPLAATKEKRMLACSSAHKALFHVHSDMEKYLLIRKSELLSHK